MRCWSQFNFAIGGVWTPSSPQWSPHSTKLQSTDHAGEEQEDECDDVDEYFQGWFISYDDVVMLLILMVIMMIKTIKTFDDDDHDDLVDDNDDGGG